jgi:hypothetical protein
MIGDILGSSKLEIIDKQFFKRNTNYIMCKCCNCYEDERPKEKFFDCIVCKDKICKQCKKSSKGHPK